MPKKQPAGMVQSGVDAGRQNAKGTFNLWV
jgi:hypothetical protein